MMLPFANIQSLNLLTGVGAPQKQGANLIASPASATGENFESLLSLFGMAQPVQPVAPTTARMGAQGVQLQSETAGTDIVREALVAALAGLTITPTIADQGISGAQLESATTQQPAKESTFTLGVNFTAQPTKDAVMPFATPVLQPWMMNLLQHQQIDLQPGNYQVLKAQTKDGTLNLEVASKDSLADPIKISLPAAALQNENSAEIIRPIRPDLTSAIAPKRTPLDAFVSQSREFETLVNNVNLRELQVTQAPVNPFEPISSAPVAISLIGEQAGQKLVLTAKLDKSAIKATETKRSAMPAIFSPTKGNSGPVPQEAFAGTVADTRDSLLPRMRPIASAIGAQAKTEDFKSIETLLTASTSQPGGAEKFESMLTGAKGSANLQTSSSQSDHPAVKLMLPQDMPTLRPEGKSITLRIEPEHLGPARLQLTMRHDTLTAKVTVDTAQAKAAVEASLDQLTDQLTKAGVKIGHIEVGVRNGGAENQLFHRQAEWFRSSRQTVARFTEELPLEVAARAIPFVRPAYVSAAGVNLYA